MQNLNGNLTCTYDSKPPLSKSFTHHPSKSLKNLHRSSHYKSYKYADIGFTITKLNKKYVAHCRVCNRTLGNTAYARLKGHRNICREESLKNDATEHLVYEESKSEVCVEKQNDLSSRKFVPQVSNDDTDPRLTFNVITPKIEKVECELNENIFEKCDSHQELNLLNEENQLKLNMIEVLLPIKYNKKLLFGDDTKKSTNLWMKVLKKAQSLGLAPTNVPWYYARDSLYSAWRHHTLQKKDAIDSGDLNEKYNIVDLSILQIEDAPMLSDSSSFDNESLFETPNNSILGRTTEDTQLSEDIYVVENKISTSTQTEDEIFKTDLRLKLLQCEAMEIENYKRSLETLELERKLQIPNSKFSAKYFPSTKNRLNEMQRNHTSDLIKIEIDD